MHPTTLLQYFYEGVWHNIGWIAYSPKSVQDLREHGQKLSTDGGRYRLVQTSFHPGIDWVITHEYPVVRNYSVEKNDRRKRVAAALYRHSRIVEAESNDIPDPDVYAGWFPWENLGSKQDAWLRSADIAIEAIDNPTHN